jgi:MoaA/NifB/PqqE/SkfB family radical SAM enzyme
VKIKRLALDIELTNRCNALCHFCPRDKTPEQGFMSEAVFHQSVERAREESIPVMLAGQGESLIHPQFETFIRHFSTVGVPFALTTNAALLTPEKSRFLLDQGIFRITFSVSDLGEDYEEVYNLDFDTMQRHVDAFMELNNGRCEVWISVVEHDINREKIPDIRRYWESRGVTGVYVYRQITRGGACQTGHYFLQSDAHRQEAEALMAAKGVSTLCNLAFVAPFVGWNGQYYICCSDYEKIEPLGTVFDYSIFDMDDIKKHSIYRDNQACLKCNYDPVNVVREAMFEVEQGEAQPSRIANRLAILKQQQQDYPELYESIDWRAVLKPIDDDSSLIARQK